MKKSVFLCFPAAFHSAKLVPDLAPRLSFVGTGDYLSNWLPCAFVLRDQSFLCPTTHSLAVSQAMAGTDLLCTIASWLLPLSFITMITSPAPHAWWAIATT